MNHFRNAFVSNAFRLCAYPAELGMNDKTVSRFLKSPMPFGCVPIRQKSPHYLYNLLDSLVSNAFRLCAYPAVR